MSNDTSRSAQNSSERDRETRTRCLSDVGRSRKSRNIFEMPSIRIAVVTAPPRSRPERWKKERHARKRSRVETTRTAEQHARQVSEAHDREDRISAVGGITIE